MLDPQLSRILSLALGLLFTLAGTHKLTGRAHFRAVLSDYRILPASLVSAGTLGIPLLELMLGIGWLISVIRIQTGFVLAVFSALLLAAYALAIAVNLSRGRRHIDCGCSFSASKPDRDVYQQLSPWLVGRNLLLAAIALIPLLGAAGRPLELADHLLFPLTSLVIVLIYAAFNQLLTNHGAIASWRNDHD